MKHGSRSRQFRAAIVTLIVVTAVLLARGVRAQDAPTSADAATQPATPSETQSGGGPAAAVSAVDKGPSSAAGPVVDNGPSSGSAGGSGGMVIDNGPSGGSGAPVIDNGPGGGGAVVDNGPAGASATSGARAGLFDFPDFNFSLGGFVRPEIAVSTDQDNPNTQRGNVFNGVPQQHIGYPPPFNLTQPLGVTVPLGTNTRSAPHANNLFSLHYMRFELAGAMKFTPHFSIIGRLRALYDPGHYSEYSPASIGSHDMGIPGNRNNIYGRPNYFQYEVDGRSHPLPLEWAGRNYLAYFPALYAEYGNGAINVRVGEQQIAWGQSIFFRVFDVPNGLDLRRHLLLDYFGEEFSDKRVPSPAVRVQYSFGPQLVADGFVEKFTPSIFPNPNTPYAVIPSQFTINDHYASEGFNNWGKLSYGLRLKGDFGDFALQAIAVRRFNPDGVFGQTPSNIVRDIPVPNVLQFPVQSVLATGINGLATALGTTSGQLLATTPFEADPSGIWSAQEFDYYAAANRASALNFYNAAVTHYPALQTLTAIPATSLAQSDATLSTIFFTTPLKAHVRRTYFRETILGLGGSYVLSGPPGSFTDQLIINLEASYTPNRTFTSDYTWHFENHPEWTSNLDIDKYYRFSSSFPATFFVFEWFRKTKSDLFGRLIKGYGGTQTKLPTGIGGQYNLFALAILQPFPARIYEADLLLVGDPKGGILVQPVFKWRPRGAFGLDLFYNYINGHLGGKANKNRNTFSTIEMMDDLTLRLTYQF